VLSSSPKELSLITTDSIIVVLSSLREFPIFVGKLCLDQAAWSQEVVMVACEVTNAYPGSRWYMPAMSLLSGASCIHTSQQMAF
jgi:hypothetical protein